LTPLDITRFEADHCPWCESSVNK